MAVSDQVNEKSKIDMDMDLDQALQAQHAKRVQHLLDEGVADVNGVRPYILGSNPPVEILESLVDHGWEINSAGPGNSNSRSTSNPSAMPLLWHVLSNHELVLWCLDHGASVSSPGDGALLERAASLATVETFKLLHSRGASLGRKCLHNAAQAATLTYPDHARYQGWPENLDVTSELQKYGEPTLVQAGGKSERETQTQIQNESKSNNSESASSANTYRERMNMVRYLVDALHLDVNGRDVPLKKHFVHRGYTPMSYAAWHGDIYVDSRELYWFLLDKGADPDSLLEIADQGGGYVIFRDIVEEWRARKARYRRRSGAGAAAVTSGASATTDGNGNRDAGRRQCCVQ